MPKHLLRALDVIKAKPKAKPYRRADGGGLYLWVPCSGVKAWQFRYRHNGKPQTATLGKVTDRQGLVWARLEADKCRGHLHDGANPTVARKLAKAQKQASHAAMFGKVKDDWIADEAKRKGWTESYRAEVEASLRNHLAKLDSLPVSEITAVIVDPCLRKVEKSAPDMATKVKQRLHGILDYAVERGRMTLNPLPRRRRIKVARKHFPAVTDHKGIGEILRTADRANVSTGVRRAHLLATFTAQRLGVIKGALWSEFDLKVGTWTILRSEMKRKDAERGDHVVILPPGLLSQIAEWHRVDGEDQKYVCPAPSGEKHITDAAVEKFYRVTLGLKGRHSPHSWRSVMKSLAADAGKPDDLAKSSLDHGIGNRVDQSYDRAQRIERRREFASWYEATLIAARDGAAVVHLRKAPERR